jgi:alpha-ribazole phosphatase/probable phosphoglycerate mutase
MKCLLIRHGETKSNLLRIYAGWSDEPLTERGILQAHHVAKLLTQYEVEVIYTSPLKRAVQTAQIIAQQIKVPIILEEGFVEMKMGPWEGKSEEEIATTYPEEWHIWQTRPAELRLPCRETLDQLLNRVLSAFYRIKMRNHKGLVVIVTHYAIIRVALLYARGQDLNLYKTITVPNCEPFELEV